MTEQEEERKFVLKILVLGDFAVGKTSLIEQYIEKKFSEDYMPTIGVNIVKRDIIIYELNIRVRLLLWDIAGQEKYIINRQAYFAGASGAFFVYDVTRNTTFESLQKIWFEDFKLYGKQDGVNLLIGNKSDLTSSRKISQQEGEKMATEIGAMEFIETSAKYGENVELAFKNIVHKVLQQMGALEKD